MKKQPERTKTETALYEALGEVSAPYWKKSKMVFDSAEADRIGKATMKVIKGDTSLATKILVTALKKDKGLREAYHANIAMAFKDNCAQFKSKTGKKSLSKEDIHQIANNAAEYFLQLFCDEIKYPEGR